MGSEATVSGTRRARDVAFLAAGGLVRVESLVLEEDGEMEDPMEVTVFAGAFYRINLGAPHSVFL